jgi:hypothetical protein
MRTQEAKKLSLPELLAKLGRQPVRSSNSKLWYCSPLREESTPSFCVEPGRQVAWIFSDHGANLKGNLLDFAMQYKKCSLKEALTWLDHIFGTEASPAFLKEQACMPASSPIQICRVRSIQHPALLSYLAERAIDRELAKLYLWELHYRNLGRPMFALGWKTDSGGWCLRASNFKASVRPTGITTIAGNSQALAIFEGMFDFLAALAHYQTTSPRGQVMILNSINHVHIAVQKINAGNYRPIKLYLDNDLAGKQTTLKLLALKNTRDCSSVFSPAKDFAQWYETGAKGK